MGVGWASIGSDNTVRLGLLLGFTSVAVMSTAPLFNKFGLTAGLPPAWGAWANAAFAAVAVAVYAKSLSKSARVIWDRRLLVISAINSGGLILLFFATSHLTPAQVAFWGRLYLVFAVLMAIVVARERLTRTALAGTIAVGVGGFFFSGVDEIVAGWHGIAAAIGYAFLFALTNFLIKRWLANVDSESTLLSMNCISCVMLLPYAFIVSGDGANQLLDLSSIGWVALAAVLNGFVGLLLYYEGQKRTSFTQASVVRSLGPLFTLVYSWPFFPTPLTFVSGIGAAFMIGGAVALALSARRGDSSGRRSG